MIHIRPAAREDSALVAAFVRELAEYEQLSHEVEASEEMLAEALFAPNPRVFCDIAESDGAPAGFALWFYTFSSFRGRHGVWLEDIFVRPQFRGGGIGKALLVHLARRCVAEGLGRFEWSVLDWNTPSIAFYEAQGAKLMHEWKICRMTGAALETLAEK
ncbi:GNAT family N-acetyltransferase [Methylosinus sp. H3A]|uniref:GNAT family N-acetyltransferase n=1 Tax=Methylosinus sp. H3A TaxID=2785786 RepID=UPI0018C30D10|nr:GNAT family N-acetyltransferase [Methylosinus sp. H3A]MBG0812103.1 GNAT family N-acetyltransferase [Methylosinus sp. H3A]